MSDPTEKVRKLVERFGERCADRMLNPATMALVAVHGRSLRRR